MSDTNLRIGAESRFLAIVVVERHDGVASALQLSLVLDDELTATVSRAHLVPEVDPRALVDFLEDIAEHHWTGWSDTKRWANLEGNLEIEASWHRTGGAAIRVAIKPLYEPWKAQGTIEVDDMSLELLGRRARGVLLASPLGET